MRIVTPVVPSLATLIFPSASLCFAVPGYSCLFISGGFSHTAIAPPLLKRRMHEAFDRLDVDGTGVITRANLRTVLGTDYDPEEVERMIKDGDDDDDGEVTYDEFRILMKDSTKKQIDDERVEGLRSPRS